MAAPTRIPSQDLIPRDLIQDQSVDPQVVPTQDHLHIEGAVERVGVIDQDPDLVGFIGPDLGHHLTEDIGLVPDLQITSPILLTKGVFHRVKMSVSFMIVTENHHHRLTTENYMIDLVIQEILTKESATENGRGDAEHGMNIIKVTMVVINHDLVLPQIRTICLLSALSHLVPGVTFHLMVGAAGTNIQQSSYLGAVM